MLDTTIRSGKGPRELLAAGSRYSYRQLSRRFKEVYGVSPKQYQLAARWEDAKDLLNDPELPVTTIAYELGFSSSQYFAQQFRAYTGMSPSDYRAQAHAQDMRRQAEGNMGG